jgi:hypothetical protein
MKSSKSMAWGPCISCKWWQIEPNVEAELLTAGLCIEEQLQPFRLRVTGNAGCNLYVRGEPAHARGSSEMPPTAAPVR